MTIKIRSTERSSQHPIIKKLFSEFIIGDIQGFIFQSNDEQLLDAVNKHSNSIQIHCLEAVEIDNMTEFNPELIFNKEEWIRKINVAKFFGSKLLLLSHLKGDTHLFRLHEVVKHESAIMLREINSFDDEKKFMVWWNSIKLLEQTKPTYEARKRQNNTIFDEIIERNGSAWGGNIDGCILSDSQEQVQAIIEIRQTHKFPLDKYDPANYFAGYYGRGGDFKTWLPLIYLKNAYQIPLILITISTLDTSKFGHTEVEKIDRTALYYKNNLSPNQNLTDDVQKVKRWFADTESSR